MKNKIVGAAYDLKASFDLAAAFVRSELTVEIFSGCGYHTESETHVAVYNTESFFMKPDEEYAFLTELFSAVPEGTCCFMKSDSSLRGNVGSELAALKDVCRLENLVFVPSFPKVSKFTRNGVQYQLEIVTNKCKKLADTLQLIHSFRETKVSCGPIEKVQDINSTIFVVDCTSLDDFSGIVEILKLKSWKALAGTSALAEKTQHYLPFESRQHYN